MTFVPHTAYYRGIHSTLYTTLTDTQIDVQALYEQRYQDEPLSMCFQRGVIQRLDRCVAHYCRIALHRPGAGRRLVVLVVEDNLTKGASGQALQCFNIMFSLDENWTNNAGSTSNGYKRPYVIYLDLSVALSNGWCFCWPCLWCSVWR